MSCARSDELPEYEVYAIRYAHMARQRRDSFIGGDPHDGTMPLDFFVWLLRSGDRIILVDTGFSEATAKTRKREREWMHCPIAALSDIGVSAEQVDDVIITHLHYDHAGNLDKLPKARFHIQDDEVDYATGRCMCHPSVRHAYSVEDVVLLVRNVYENRVVFHDGDDDIAPGVRVLNIGGHTKGLQAVLVNTRRGQVVLASDASHYYENMEDARPFPIIYNMIDVLTGYAKLAAAATSPDHIIPGHDPKVLDSYPFHNNNPNIVKLHVPPVQHTKTAL